ncbi:MAG: hypothetical protein QG670_417 [Thermoproteota archaeon]|nr:hypothetical protein [Thermoproteota archaeon]
MRCLLLGEAERVDTIDLIMRILHQHERTLDSLVKHLDSTVDRVDIQKVEAALKRKSRT